MKHVKEAGALRRRRPQRGVGGGGGSARRAAATHSIRRRSLNAWSVQLALWQVRLAFAFGLFGTIYPEI